MKQILDGTQNVSAEFGGGNTHFALMIDEHAGGEWTLQAHTPAGHWIPVHDQARFSGSGVWTVATPPPGVPLRIAGGVVGALAWVSE